MTRQEHFEPRQWASRRHPLVVIPAQAGIHSARSTVEVLSDIGHDRQQVDPGSSPGMTRLLVVPAPLPVIPAQAGIHSARSPVEVPCRERVYSPLGRDRQSVDPGSSPGMTRLLVVPAPLPVIPAQAGIHSARSTLEVLSDIGRDRQQVDPGSPPGMTNQGHRVSPGMTEGLRRPG